MRTHFIRVQGVFAILIIGLTIFSCKNENKENISNENKKSSFEEKRIDFTVDFPDTVFVNKYYNGQVRYCSVLDTIITTFGDKKKNRYTRFILTTSDNVNYDVKHLKSIVKDTFGALNNRTIPFYDIKFDKPGVYYIDGIINDIALIDLDKKDKNGDYLSRFIENETRVTYKVVVINNHEKKYE